MTHNPADDAIDALARRLTLLPDREGIESVEANIARATAEDAWEEVGKWHRVRLRLIRYQRERERYAAISE